MAILSNTIDLEEAYVHALEAEGSAHAENEKYLDSIQGKIDQFNNAVQTMWSNTLDDSLIKGIVAFGTEIIKLIDKIKLVPTILGTLGLSKLIPWLIKGKTGAKTLGGALKVLAFGADSASISSFQLVSSIVKLFAETTKGIPAMVSFGYQVQGLSGAVSQLGKGISMAWAAIPGVGKIMLIAAAIGAVIAVIEGLHDSVKEVAEAAREALAEYENAQNTLQSHKKTIDAVSKDYEKLSKGVDQFGNNVSLSTDEYERYNEIVNQIADMFPHMVSGYTAEGNAIIALKGNVESLTEAYKEKAQAARDALLVDSNNIFDTFRNNTVEASGFFGARAHLSKKYDISDLGVLLSNDENKIKDLIDQRGDSTVRELFKDAGIEYTFLDKTIDIAKNNIAQLKAYYNTLKMEFEAEVNPVKSLVNAYIGNNEDYQKLSDEGKNIAQAIISGFDAEFYARDEFDSWTDVAAWIDTNVVQKLQNSDNVAEFEAAFNLQTKFNNNEIDASEYRVAVQEFIKTLKELGFDEDIITTVTLVFGVDDVNTKVNRAKDLLEDQYDAMADTLSKEDLDIIDKYASSWDIDGNTLYSWDELQQMIASAKETIEDTSITGSLSNITLLEDAFNSLGEAVQEFKEDGTVAADTLESLKDTFGKTEGFEELYKVLATGEGNVEEAITNVANAYIAQKDILSDITDEELQIMIARLESLGVINAQEVLQKRQMLQQELNEKLQGYNIDLSAYATAEEAKIAIAAQAGLDLAYITDENFDALLVKYKDEVDAFATKEEQKIQIAQARAREEAELNRTAALEKLNSDYVGNERYGESYQSKLKEIENAYNTAMNGINSIDTQFDNIASILDGYYNESFKFDFSGNKIGIGRDFDEEVGDKSEDKAKDELDKLRKKYENKISHLENQQTYLENEIEKLEAQDKQVSKGVYEEQIRLEEEKIGLYEKERAALLDKMKDVAKDSDLWQEYADAVWETEHAIQESALAVLEFKQNIADLYIEVFDKIEDAYNAQQELYDKQSDYIRNNIEYAELTNQGIPASAYKDLENVQKNKYQSTLAEIADLENTLNNAYSAKYGDENCLSTQEISELVLRLQDAKLEAQEARNEIENINDELKELYVEAFNKLGDVYDALGSLYDDRTSYVENYIELQTLRGNSVSTGSYDYLISNEQNKLNANLAALEAQRKKLQDAMANGVKAGSEEWIEMQAAIRATEAAIQDSYIALEQFDDELHNLYAEAFNKVRDSFSDVTDVYEDQQSFIESYISYLETVGVKVPAEMYEKLGDIELDKQQANIQKLEDLQDALAKMESEGYGPEDEEWVQAQADIRAVEKAIWDSEVAMAEFNKQIREMETEKFEEFIKRIDDMVSELDRVHNLLSKEDVSTEDGAWTAEGITSLGLLYQKMEIAKKQVADYQAEIDKLNDEYKSGAISEQEYNDRLTELKNSQWDSIEMYEDAKDAIVDINEARIDMIEEGVQKEIDAYQELIDLKKKELDSERDLYEFRKNIQKQSRDIAALERRLAAMSGSTDAATIAERTKLEQQLREAQESLDDTYYTHAMDSQSTALDDENEAYVTSKEDYIEMLREALEDVESVVTNTISQVLINADTVLGELNGVSGEYGITLSESLTSPWISAAQQAEAFKNSALAQEYEFALQNDIFTGEITADFSNLFGQTTGMANQFQTNVYTVMEAIKLHVNNSTSDMTSDLVIPFSTAMGYAQNTFSPNVMAQLQAVANKAESLVYTESSDIAAPFITGQNAANTFDKTAEEAIENVAEAAEEYSPSTAADLKAPPTEGKSAWSLFGTTVSRVFATMIADAQRAATDVGSDMGDIVAKAKAAAAAIASVGSAGGGSGSGGGGGGSGSGSGSGGGIYNDSNAVKTLQQTLNIIFKAGIDSDGVWGPKSEAALRIAQGTMSRVLGRWVPTNGVYDRNTHNAMLQYIDHLESVGKGMDGVVYETQKKKLAAAFYAKGTTGTTRDEWAMTDEIGDELVLIPGKDGNLQYMRKGTAVIPAEISANLMEWGKLNPNVDMSGTVQGVNLMTNVVNKPELNLSFDALVKAERITEETLPAVKKLVTEELEKFTRKLNYNLKRVGSTT